MADDSKNNEEGDTQDTAPRRRILRYLAAGGGLGTSAALVPATWTKPLVKTVVLPAHAQTSVVRFDGTGLVGEGPLNDITYREDIQEYTEPDQSQFQQFVEQVRSAVLSDAHARPLLPLIPLGFCLEIQVANLLDEGSRADVTLTSNVLGTDTGQGTFGELQNGGITTGEGYNVRTTSLNPDGTGSATVAGIPVDMSGGDCSPEDSGESGPISQRTD